MPASPPRQTSSEPVYPEHQRLVSGQGCYVGDIALAEALVVTFVRAPLAHGRIRSVDVQAARAAPGVVAVYTGADVAGIGPLPVNPVLAQVAVPPYPILAGDEILAVGQPVVAIVADSVQAGADAADLVELDIDDQTPVLPRLRAGSDAADAADATGEAPSPALAQRWSEGDLAAAFDAASHIVEVTMQHPRLAPSPLETRSIAARYNDPAEAETLTIWLSTQTPHRSRDFLATMLGVDKQTLRMIAPDVGGAFGMKASLYPEEVLVAWAALRLQRSVRWQATRSEDFLAATHGRGACTQGRLAVAADGRFLGLQAQVRCPLGYWLPNSAAIPAWNAARILPGPYRCDAVQVATEASLSHTAPVGIYRGAGRPEAAALMERLVEKAARATRS